MTSSRDSISEPLAAPCWILSSVPRKPNHGFFLQERTRQALHARNDAPGSAGCSAKNC